MLSVTELPFNRLGLRNASFLVRLSHIRPQRPRAVGEADGELNGRSKHLPILPAFPPKAGMQEE